MYTAVDTVVEVLSDHAISVGTQAALQKVTCGQSSARGLEYGYSIPAGYAC